MPSSPDSSSDSSTGSPHHTFDGPNIEAENCLPGVVSAIYLPSVIIFVLHHNFVFKVPLPKIQPFF